MARVNRKRKLKQFDPAYRGPKEDTEKNLDQAPFDDSDLEGEPAPKKKRKGKKRQLGEEELARVILREDEYLESKKKPTQEEQKFKILPRQSWESRKQFERRLKAETQRALLEETRKSRKTTQKRKEFLQQKKLKKSKEKHREHNPQSSKVDDGVPDFKTNDPVKFGEVADRPPELKVVPKNKKKNKQPKVTPAPTASEVGERRQMELLRERVVSAYKQLKKKRAEGLAGKVQGNL